jgi:hypothetical protein
LEIFRKLCAFAGKSFVSGFKTGEPNWRIAVPVEAESVPLGMVGRILAAAHGLGAERNATGFLSGTHAMGLRQTGKADRFGFAGFDGFGR